MGRFAGILAVMAALAIWTLQGSMAQAHGGHEHPTPKPKPTKEAR